MRGIAARAGFRNYGSRTLRNGRARFPSLKKDKTELKRGEQFDECDTISRSQSGKPVKSEQNVTIRYTSPTKSIDAKSHDHSKVQALLSDLFPESLKDNSQNPQPHKRYSQRVANAISSGNLESLKRNAPEPWNKPASRQSFSKELKPLHPDQLLEKLFPRGGEITKVVERDASFGKTTKRGDISPMKLTDANKKDIVENKWLKKGRVAGKAVLLLKAASKNLIMDDFIRLSPQANNLKGWSLIEKVIPERNSRTLEREGSYLIVFASIAEAKTYQAHVTRLAQVNSEAGSFSRKREGAAFHAALSQNDYIHIQQLARSYSLTPPSQKLQLRLLQTPFSPHLEQIIDNDGYPELKSEPDQVKVIFRLGSTTIASIPKAKVEAAIASAEHHRNLPWTSTEFGRYRVQRWIPDTIKDTGAYAMPMVFNPEGSSNSTIHGAYSDVPQPTKSISTSETSETSESAADDNVDDLADAQDESDLQNDWFDEDTKSSDVNVMDDSDETTTSTKSRSKRNGDVFLIGLSTKAEAYAFVRYWHRRPFPNIGSDETPLVNAEVLW